jgi:hypothetical protein
MIPDPQLPVDSEFGEDDVLHLARLSIDDLDQVASAWRALALKGDKTAIAVATALVSVVAARRHRAAATDRVRRLRVSRASPALRKVAEWIAAPLGQNVPK